MHLANRHRAATRRARIDAFIETHRQALAAHGAVRCTWRNYDGRRLGPYYHLSYVEAGKPRALYLGCSAALARKTAQALAKLQRPAHQARCLAQLRRQARAALQRQKESLRRQLAGRGIILKGWEFRGVRKAFPLRSSSRASPAPGPSSPASSPTRKNPTFAHKISGEEIAATQTRQTGCNVPSQEPQSTVQTALLPPAGLDQRTS